MTTLRHYGKAMAWDPVNMNRARLLGMLYLGHPVRIMLEPGDATRYELEIQWACGALYVSRIVSGDLLFGGVYDGDRFGRCLTVISNGNDWTVAFLTWWLNGLLDQLRTFGNRRAGVIR